MLRMLEPETVKLDLTDGEWLVVKKRLTAGEERRVQQRAGTTFVDGRAQYDQLKVGTAIVTEYLLDWSATDPQGKPIKISGQPPDAIEAALNELPGDAFREIQDAVFSHTARIRAEIDAQKKTTSGSPEPDRIYESVS